MLEKWGLKLILSMPPATATSICPRAMLWAANWILFIPEAQTLFTVVQGTEFGMPALIAACRAGACPQPDCSTCPINTSSTELPSIEAASNAAAIAVAPRSTALTEDKAPKKLPIGVLFAETITTFFIGFCF